MGLPVVKIQMSERCFRFKPDAIGGHAPAAPGVYEFVTFDANQAAKVVYVGLAEASIQESLQAHLEGRAEPAGRRLLSAYPNIYFDYVARASVGGPEGLKDVAEALIVKHKPELNLDPPASAKVELKEVELF